MRASVSLFGYKIWEHIWYSHRKKCPLFHRYFQLGEGERKKEKILSQCVLKIYMLDNVTLHHCYKHPQRWAVKAVISWVNARVLFC